MPPGPRPPNKPPAPPRPKSVKYTCPHRFENAHTGYCIGDADGTPKFLE